MPLLSGSAVPTVLDCLTQTIRDALFKLHGMGGRGNRGSSLAEVTITDLHKCVNVYVHACVYMTKIPFLIQWHECTKTFQKPNGGTFTKFRKLKIALHLVRAHVHAHTHNTLLSTSACRPISHLWIRWILHFVKKSQNTADLVHVKMAAVWKLCVTPHICTIVSHSADHQENSGATALIFVAYVTRQHSQILYTYTVFNTSNYAFSLVGIWLLFMSVSKHTVTVTLKKK